MKNYIQALIKRDGEQAAGKIAEDFQQFVEWLQSYDESDFYPQYYATINGKDEKGYWDYRNSKYVTFNDVWIYFQDEVLNK